MKPLLFGLTLAVVALVLLQIVYVVPVSFVLWNHIVHLEVRTRGLCSHGLPVGIDPADLDGCRK